MVAHTIQTTLQGSPRGSFRDPLGIQTTLQVSPRGSFRDPLGLKGSSYSSSGRYE